MKVAAIIAEYNPFHNGHLYQINTVWEQLGADFVIIVMSGDFMQRGIPALLDKYARSEMALSCGADLVFELPSYFALGSAEYFAKGAVSLIDKLGVVDFIHFGSECGDISVLEKCARIIADESVEYKTALNKYLKIGNSYPSAREKAVKELVLNEGDFEDIFSNPNNILGLEYIKALIQRKSNVKAVTLERKGEGYSSDVINAESFASANAIRTALENGNIDKSSLKSHMPEKSFEVLDRYAGGENGFLYLDDFSQILIYRLLQIQAGNDKTCFADFYDVGEQLSNTIYNSIMKFTTFSEFALECKSKNLTYSRICRSLMHILLDMSRSDAEQLKENDYSQYARLLGFTAKGQSLLKSIKANSSIPIITKPVNALKQLDNLSAMSLSKDIYVANIYESVKQQKIVNKLTTQSKPLQYKIKNEFSREIVRLP